MKRKYELSEIRQETLCVQRTFEVYLKHLVQIWLHLNFPHCHCNCSKSWNFYISFHQQSPVSENTTLSNIHLQMAI